MATSSRPLIGQYSNTWNEFYDIEACRPFEPCYRDYADWTSWKTRGVHLAVPVITAVAQTILISNFSSNGAAVGVINGLAISVQLISLGTIGFCHCVVPEDPPEIKDRGVHDALRCMLIWNLLCASSTILCFVGSMVELSH